MGRNSAAAAIEDQETEIQQDIDQEEQVETDLDSDEQEIPEVRESEEEEEESDDAPAASEGHGRFTMKLKEASETFSIPKTRIAGWIKKDLIECHKPNQRRVFVDPADIGRLIEGEHDQAPVRETKDTGAAAPKAKTKPRTPAQKAKVLKLARAKKSARKQAEKRPPRFTWMDLFAASSAATALTAAAMHFLR